MNAGRAGQGDRWPSVRVGAFAGLLALWSASHALPSEEPVAARPHIVVLIADDLGWADVGYHDSKIRTPHLDRLAAEGVRLESHYVLPTCTPTRVGLVSGRYPSRFGVLSPAYGHVLPDDLITLPKALREAGYSTHLSGKWHMGSPPEFVPRRYGFDTSYGYFHGQTDPYTHHYKNGERSWHRNDELLDEEGHATDLITQEAIRVIEEEHSRPFFLYVAYSVPHFPLREPDRWTEPYRDVYDAPSRQWYAGSVTHMDEGVGKILAAIDRKGLREKTLIVFVSDNGGQRSWSSKTEYGGDYAKLPHTVLGDNRPLRGWKGDVYEGGMRVPAVLRWPGVLQPARVDAPVHIVDWMPTLCALAGWKPKGDLRWDGRDVWDVVQGRSKSSSRTLYWKTPQARALRDGDWKLVAPNGDKKPELYQLAEDPYEAHDLAPSSPEKLAQLQMRLREVSSGDRGRSPTE